jgi:glycosyltransferase involved in cell wall biosynthesis
MNAEAKTSPIPTPDSLETVHPLVVSTVASAASIAARTGSASYSYRYVFEAFEPLLQRWNLAFEIDRPESRLDFALRGVPGSAKPLHIGFLPLDHFYFSRLAPNIAFPFWDFPELPDQNLGGNPRNNWVHLANRLDGLLTASAWTREVFLRAGVQTPIWVVPVPLQSGVNEVPVWKAGQSVTLSCSAYELSSARTSQSTLPASEWEAVPAVPSQRAKLVWRIRSRLQIGMRLRNSYRDHIKPRLPETQREFWTLTAEAMRTARQQQRAAFPTDLPFERAKLEGVVFTSIFNPFDSRKNWEDALTAFLLALREQEDALLVLKLVVSPQRIAAALHKVQQFYESLQLSHRCRVLLIGDYLDEPSMEELRRATTFYLNTSRAEGGCLPLQNFLATARPAIAPCHTAIADYFHADMGWIIESHREPTHWPQDPERRCTTTWHRLVWSSLHDHIRDAYRMAKSQPHQYETMAMTARLRMNEHAAPDVVWPRLCEALHSVANGPRKVL